MRIRRILLKGDIAARLAEHRKRQEILDLTTQRASDGTEGNGTIMFTWAFVSPEANRVEIEGIHILG